MSLPTDNASRLAQRAAVLGHPSRTRMLLALMDDRTLSVSQLAAIADVTMSTASEHLALLCRVGWITRARAGRQRLYRVASLEAAQAIEALLRLDAPPPRAKGLGMSPLHFARTCYDHLAGRVGVAVTEALCRRDWLVLQPDADDFVITAGGAAPLADLGLDAPQLRTQRRAFATACIDWSERRPHLAGALGAALCRVMLERHWMERRVDSRALDVTATGWRELARHLDMHRDDLIAPLRAPSVSWRTHHERP